MKFEDQPPGLAPDAKPSAAEFKDQFTRVVLDQPGEAYCLDTAYPNSVDQLGEAKLGIHVHQPGEVAGTLHIASYESAPATTAEADDTNEEAEQKTAFRFTMSTTGLTQQPTAFYQLKADWYAQLADEGIPGSAWFRKQRDDALALAGEDAKPTADRSQFNRRGFDDTFEIFSGGRAISENLQLDRQLQIVGEQAQPNDVPISSIKGITIEEFDWKELNKGKDPKLDKLSEFIPADQHAIFFPSFSAMMRLIDRSDQLGTPAMFSLEPRAEDSRAKDRYQTQLCLEASQLSRLLGPSIIRSVAVTGSDPYLRTGTDVAILFDAEHPTTLWTYVRGKHTAAQQAHDQVRPMSGEFGGIEYHGVASPDRSICSFVARSGDVILVTNSLQQVERLAALRSWKETPLCDLPEYTFMRDRYPLGDTDETAFLMITDATIRRWCGPKWRIANSRRTRAAAQLAQLTASSQNDILTKENFLEQLPPVGDLGRVMASNSGLRSPIYNTMNFLTPIAEFDLTHVTDQERNAYDRWRTNYERNWRTKFDPIAARISITDDRMSGDVTVMPLIGGSDYAWMARDLRGLKLPPTGGDRHDEAAVQVAIPITPQMRGMVNLMLGQDKSRALGETITIYLDQDEEFLAKAKRVQRIDELAVIDPPIGLSVEIEADAERLGKTLDSLARDALGEKTQTRTYRDQTVYMMDPRANDIHVEFSGLNGAALMTTNGKVMDRAIDRELARAAGEAVPTSKPEWLGESISFQIDQSGWELLEFIFRTEATRLAQERSWSNLPILNEWKTRYPDRDPLQVHEQVWGTTLLCPAGGEYVWNAEQHTMESTVTGHPGNAKVPSLAPDSPLQGFGLGNFGLTFEGDGLRARAELHTAPTEKKE